MYKRAAAWTQDTLVQARLQLPVPHQKLMPPQLSELPQPHQTSVPPQMPQLPLPPLISPQPSGPQLPVPQLPGPLLMSPQPSERPQPFQRMRGSHGWGEGEGWFGSQESHGECKTITE